MSILESLLLGLLQGLTEFLPVSSSGHLVLAQSLLKIDAPLVFFDLILHLGTLAAVSAVLWRDLIALIKNPLEKNMRLLLIATLPACAIYLLFEGFIKDSFETGAYLGYGFLITALFLVLTDFVVYRAKKRGAQNMPLGYSAAAIMGTMQGLATLPAVSRSGSTICAALIMGVERKQAARFSFLMSVPIIVGGTIVEGIKAINSSTSYIPPFSQLMVGFFAAAITGVLAIKLMLNIIQKHRLFGFSIYLVILAVVVFVLQANAII